MRSFIILVSALFCAALSPAEDIVTSTGRKIDSEQIKDVAAAHAERKFSQNSPGSSNSWAFAWDRDIGEPEARSGWVDEWRVSGEIGLKTMSSQGGISSPARKFEAVVAYKAGRLVVIDFTAR